MRPATREAAEAFIACIEAMNAAMDIPETLPGIRSEDIPQLARYADHEANPLYPVPVRVGPRKARRICSKQSPGGRSP